MREAMIVLNFPLFRSTYTLLRSFTRDLANAYDVFIRDQTVRRNLLYVLGITEVLLHARCFAFLACSMGMANDNAAITSRATLPGRWNMAVGPAIITALRRLTSAISPNTTPNTRGGKGYPYLFKM